SLLSGHGPAHECETHGRSSETEAREPRGAGRLELRPARQLGQGRIVEELLANDPRLGDLRVADDRAELEMAVAEPAQLDQVALVGPCHPFRCGTQETRRMVGEAPLARPVLPGLGLPEAHGRAPPW